MPAYSRARLEGLAAEAWLRYFVDVARGMTAAAPTTVLVRLARCRFAERGAAWDPRIPEALAHVRPRVARTVRCLKAAGIELRGATCVVRHTRAGLARSSVDVRVRSFRCGTTRRLRGAGERGLLEVKWSRFRLSKARRAAREKLPALRAIRKTGRWCGPEPRAGKRACAPLIGTLIMCRGAWECQLYRGKTRRARRTYRISGRLRPSGAAQRKARQARAAAQAQVPALLEVAWSDPESGADSSSEESSASSSELSESSASSGSSALDEHDGYSTDSD